MRFEDDFLDRMAAPLQQAFEAMEALERGAIANQDEKRMVGHYWLRAPDLAPSPEIAAEINHTLTEIKQFAAGTVPVLNYSAVLMKVDRHGPKGGVTRARASHS